MRILLLCLFILVISCQQNKGREDTSEMPVDTYFNYGDSTVLSGGVQLIPITTPVGNCLLHQDKKESPTKMVGLSCYNQK